MKIPENILSTLSDELKQKVEAAQSAEELRASPTKTARRSAPSSWKASPAADAGIARERRTDL